MILKLTLVPNRAKGPPRGVHIILYRREGRRLVPYVWEEYEGQPVRCEPMRYRDIARSNDVDPEFARAWSQHVASLGARDKCTAADPCLQVEYCDRCATFPSGTGG